MSFQPWLNTRPKLDKSTKELYYSHFPGEPTMREVYDGLVRQREEKRMREAEQAAAIVAATKAAVAAAKAAPPPPEAEPTPQAINPIWIQLLKEPVTKPELVEKLKPFYPNLDEAQLKEMTHEMVRVVKPKYVFSKGKMFYFLG